MKITRLEDCELQPVNMSGIEGVSKQVPIGKADGAPHFSIRVFTVEPGGHTPHHSHDAEHLNYILEGEGEVMDGDTPQKIRKGDYILVKPNDKHQYRNSGSTPLVFMCMVPSEYE